MNKYTELKRQAEALLSQMDRGKEFIIGHVSGRLAKAADENPQDKVICAVSHVVERMSRKDPSRVISQAELESVYQKLAGIDRSGTRFRELLGDLLITAGPQPVRTGKEYAEAKRDIFDEAVSEIKPETRDGLSQLFEHAEDRLDPKAATDAQGRVELELKSMGFRSKAKLEGGNARHLVFAAQVQTNRGQVTFHVPVEASSGRLPSVFVSQGRFLPLSRQELSKQAEEIAGCRLDPPSVPAILDALDKLSGSEAKSASDEQVESIAGSLPQDDGSGGLSAAQLYASIAQKEDAIRDIEVPRTEVPEPLRAIASEVEESVAEAGIGYPQAAVRLAKRMLNAELVSMGFRSAQVRAVSPTGDGMLCQAVLDTPKGKVAIEVPIEMKGDRPLMPSVFAHGDIVDDFTADKLKAFVSRDLDTLPTAVRRDSALLSKSWGELKSDLIDAVARDDHDACHEIIEAIAEQFGSDMHKQAIQGYKELLKHKAAWHESRKSRCSMVIKSANSIYDMCGHLMVPLHKVVQDEMGRCHLASTYRARQSQDEEGAFFSNAKVLVND